MFAKELIGKTCIREKPVMKERFIRESGFMLYPGEKKVEVADYQYCTEPVKIIAATDNNIVCERMGALSGNPIRTILDVRYCDDAWVDYEALVGDCGEEDCDHENCEKENGGKDDE